MLNRTMVISQSFSACSKDWYEYEEETDEVTES